MESGSPIYPTPVRCHQHHPVLVGASQFKEDVGGGPTELPNQDGEAPGKQGFLGKLEEAELV